MSNTISPKLRQSIINFPSNPARGQVTRFCQTNGISRSVFYKIKTRVEQDGADQALTPRKRGPAQAPPGRTSQTLEAMALQIRFDLTSQGLDAGPLSVAAQMRRRGVMPPSRATLARIFTRNQVVKPEPSKRPRASYRRFTYPAPNGLWQMDGTEFELDNGTKRVIFQVEDDHSRKILANSVSKTENGPAAIKVVSAAISRYGVPQRFLTDNHLALNQHRRGKTAPLEKFLKSLGVHTMSGQVKHPQTQGKNERLHQTLHKFLNAHRPIYSAKRLVELLEEFTAYYNQDRPHQALDTTIDQTPDMAYAATAKAPAPKPPDPTPKPTKPDRHVLGQTPPINDQPGGLISAERKVNTTGQIHILGCVIYVGTRLNGQVCHILWDQNTITVFDPDGSEIGQTPRPRTPPKGKSHRISFATKGFICH